MALFVERDGHKNHARIYFSIFISFTADNGTTGHEVQEELQVQEEEEAEQ